MPLYHPAFCCHHHPRNPHHNLDANPHPTAAAPPLDAPALCDGVAALLLEDRWEAKLGGLLAAKLLIERCRAPDCPLPPAFDALAQSEALRLLEDSEVRVRLATGQLLGALAAKRGAAVFAEARARVVASVLEHYDRPDDDDEVLAAGGGMGSGGTAAGGGDDAASDAGSMGCGDTAAAADALGARRLGAGSGGGALGGADSPVASRAGSRAGSSADLLGALLDASYRPTPVGTGAMRHGTEGWKCLETSVRALAEMMERAGPGVRPMLDDEIVGLLCRSVYHPNRFVRETAHRALASLCGALTPAEAAAAGTELAPRIADGLSDSWSQVRYAACVAARAFLGRVPAEDAPRFYPSLLPPMCLNRYYVAEGVRLYAQESWRRAVGERGRALVAQYAGDVVSDDGRRGWGGSNCCAIGRARWVCAGLRGGAERRHTQQHQQQQFKTPPTKQPNQKHNNITNYRSPITSTSQRPPTTPCARPRAPSSPSCSRRSTGLPSRRTSPDCFARSCCASRT